MSVSTFFIPHAWTDSRLKVALIGVGGTGGEVLDALLKMDTTLKAFDHPGLHVTAFDPATISTANIGRQRFYCNDDGANKAVTAIQRINLYMGHDWEGYPFEFSATEHLVQFDLIITAVDKASVRASIGSSIPKLLAHNRGSALPMWLDMGNGVNDGQAIFGHMDAKAHPIRLPNVYDLYADQLDALEDDNSRSCSLPEAVRKQDLMTNKLVADCGMTILWNLLRHGKTDHHGCFINVREGEVTPIKIDPEVWATFGYEAAA